MARHVGKWEGRHCIAEDGNLIMFSRPHPTTVLFSLIFCATLLGKLKPMPALFNLPLYLRLPIFMTCVWQVAQHPNQCVGIRIPFRASAAPRFRLLGCSTTSLYVRTAAAANGAARRTGTDLSLQPPRALMTNEFPFDCCRHPLYAAIAVELIGGTATVTAQHWLRSLVGPEY
eukprot:SAG11_NODE_2675_length_3106_cov_2.195211_5_plen_173_part_00